MKIVKLSELFNIERGVRLTKADQEPGDIPLVTAGEDNYGINGYISNGKSKLFKNAITVDMFCHAVYRDYEFYCDDNIIVLTPKNEMKLNELLYYSLCICQNKYKFGYGRQLRLSRLDEIKLPVEIPDWVYEVEKPDLSKYKEPFTNDPTPELNVNSWKEFKISDLFKLKTGKTLNITDMEKGKIPYVSASGNNNGVIGYVNTDKDIFKPNAITVPIVGNSVAIAGYQDKEFVLSNNAIALYSKYKGFNKYHAMFIIPILKLEKFRYGYGRKWGLGRMEQSVIKLPATPEGEPDYQFMEDYIKTLPYSKYI